MSIPIKKVLISDNVDKKCENLLKANGIQVVSKLNLSPGQLIEELKDCEGLIVRSDTKVTKDIIEATQSLKVIGRAGTGVDNIDTEAATKKGVIVLNAPNGNSISACELACSFISSLARNVPSACQSMKEGKWERKAFAGGSELEGKTLAVIGLGRIGREVAIRMQSYRMKVVGFDPIISKEEAKALSIELLQLDEIWPIADYVTVHTPLIPQTRNLINQSVFSKCKPSIKIINAARGGIINEADLLHALENGNCGGAALDVFSEEPPKSETLRKLISHPKVIATPHLGASTNEAQTRVAVEVAEQFVSLKDLTSEYKISGILNAPALLASRQSKNSPWLNLSERLGRLLSRIVKNYSTLKGNNIKISLAGPDIQGMKFLSTSILLGVLSADAPNKFNLINSPMYAKEAGINFVIEDDGKTSGDLQNVLKIYVQSETMPTVSIQGTVIDNIPYLLQVEDAVFAPATVQLNEDVRIFSAELSKSQDALKTIVSSSKKINNLSVAYGKQAWIIVSGIIEDFPSTASLNCY